MGRFGWILMVWVCGAAAVVGCGGNTTAPGGPGTSNVVQCSKDQFRLVGSLDGVAVDDQEQASGGMTQFNGGSLDTVMGTPDDGAGAGPTEAHLTWTTGLVFGESGPATGTIDLAGGLPHAGETLCVGSGTIVGFTSDGDFYFSLRDLHTGTNCETVVTGQLDGCWD